MDKRYVVTKPAFKAHYAVTSPDGSDDYYVKIKTKIRPSQPRLTFHSGPDSHGPVVGVVHFQASTVGMKVGLGDPLVVAAVEWEDLECMNKTTHAKYTWSVTLPPLGGGGGPPHRRTFTWTRTRSQGIDGTKPTAATNRHWKLSEEGKAEEIVALFTGQAKIGHCGTLAMRGDLGDKLHRMALITLMGLYERVRSSGGG